MLIAPTINFLLYFNENLFIKNLVLKLSVPSTIISKSFTILFKFFSDAFSFKILTFTSLLINFILLLKISTLNFPTSFEVYKICLWRFEISTLSWSIAPIYPTPHLANKSATGLPNPPIPTIKTFELIIFFCPNIPISLSIICLEYLSSFRLDNEFFTYPLIQIHPNL